MFKKFFIQLLIDFIKQGLIDLLSAYFGKKEDEKTNRDNRERLEEANTDEELQDSANDLAGHLGRNP
ncbi:hypothetical protein ACES2L_06080 [Bdellovibrio bacteriovorus]